MEKNLYIAPTMEVAELEIVEMLAVSNKDFNVSDETTDADASMSNRHRGEWGNLWK